MFEEQYKIIATTNSAISELYKQRCNKCKVIGAPTPNDFIDKKVKSADELSQKMDAKTLKELIEIDNKVNALHKQYSAAQKVIIDAWKKHEDERKKEAAKILEDLKKLEKQIFENRIFHPGPTDKALTSSERKLIQAALSK